MAETFFTIKCKNCHKEIELQGAKTTLPKRGINLVRESEQSQVLFCDCGNRIEIITYS